MKSIQKIIEKYKLFFSDKKFKKNIKREKSKLYVQNDNSPRYKSKRNKFKLFTSKLEFENTFWEIQKMNLYYYLTGIFLFWASLYILFFSHFFSIKSIDVIREDELINIDLSYRSIEKYRYRPILFADKNEMKQSLLSHQPNIKEVYIRKILPDNIKIILQSFTWVFGFEYENKFYEITSNGVMIPSKTKESTQMIKIIGLNNVWIVDYKKVFKEESILKIKNIIDLVHQNSSFVSVWEIIYYVKEAEVHIINQNGTRILFDLNKEEKVQIEKLNIFNKNYASKVNIWIVYIDLRINEKIIYCAKDSEFQCKQNIKSIYE